MQRQMFLLIVVGALLASSVPTHAIQLSQQSTPGSRVVVDNAILNEPEQNSDAPLPTLQTIFTVLDQEGNPIQNPPITKAQVILNDQTYEAEFRVPDPQAMPMYIAVLLDASGSMVDRIEQVRTAAIRSLGETPPGTYFMIFRFSDERTSMLDTDGQMTQERAEAEAALRNITIGGNTCLYDSINATIQDLRREVPPGATRRAVIAFTDGIDEKRDSPEPCSTDTLPEVIQEARETGNRSGQVPIPIYTIGLCGAEDSESNPCLHTERFVIEGTEQEANPLTYLAEETGGITAQGSLGDINASFDQIMDRLNSQWLAEVALPARQGQNQATLEIFLAGQTQPLVASFDFASQDSYEQSVLSTVAISSVPQPNNDEYRVPLRITNPEGVGEITIRVVDVDSATEVVSARTTLDQEDIAVTAAGDEVQARIPTEALAVGKEYALVVYATNDSGEELETPTSSGVSTELDRRSFTHRSDIAFSFTILPRLSQNHVVLEIDLAGTDELGEELRYAVEITDNETGGRVGEEEVQGVLRQQGIVIDSDDYPAIIHYLQDSDEAREYAFSVSLWKDSDDRSQGATETEAQVIAPLGFWALLWTKISISWVLGIILASMMIFAGIFVYSRRSTGAKEQMPPPRMYSDLTGMVGPSSGSEPIQGQISVKVRFRDSKYASRYGEKIYNTPFTIGRGKDNTVSIPEDKRISRTHIKVTSRNGALCVTDTSTHGTTVDDEFLTNGQTSRPGTRPMQVKLGASTIELEPQKAR